MNNSEQPKPAQEPKPVAEILKDSREGVEAWQKSRQERMAQGKAGQVPQSEAEQRKTSEWEKAQDLGKVIQERRRQREEAVKAKEPASEGAEIRKPNEPWGAGARVQERIQQIEREMAKKRRTPETKEGEKFFAEMLTNPEDPRVEKVQEMLAGHFGKEEVDPPEVMKQAMTGRMATGEECAPYLIHVAEGSKGEILGVHTGAVVETVNADGDVSKDAGVLLGCYTLVAPEARGKGVWKELFKAQAEAAEKDAKSRKLNVKGFMAEAHGDMEPILNGQEVKRAYIKMEDGSFRELPYEQPPLDWDTKTGEPTEDAGTVPEHLMLKLSSGENQLSGEELMEMVRGMYYYNNYREEEYFDNEEAYKKHTESVENVEQKLTESIGGREVRLLSAKERGTMIEQGVKFEEHMQGETSKEADEESKEAQWKAAAVHERETSMEKMRRLFTPHGETGGAETKTAETAEKTREKTIEEISQHLVEHPEKALSIFKKGVSLKLEKAAIGFTSFWKRAGAEALKGASWPAEKVVGSSLAKLNETVWAFQEHLLTRPGAKRLEKVLAIQANIEALKKAGAITEGHADYLLAEIMRHIRHATGDLLAETQDHYSWEEKKEKTLDLIKTFGHSRKKLSGWGKEQKAKAAGKKEMAKQKRVAKVAGKFK